jgi:hypothetical protein
MLRDVSVETVLNLLLYHILINITYRKPFLKRKSKKGYNNNIIECAHAILASIFFFFLESEIMESEIPRETELLLKIQ